jgi:predicted amidohydrolase
MSKLTVATCQFRIESEPDRNLRAIERQMKMAQKRGAHLAHFSETCLSGYLGSEVPSAREQDWAGVREAMHTIMGLAGELRMWVVVGCNHRLSRRHKPHNSLYVVNDRGELIDRYDKMFCTGSDDRTADLAHYSPGEAFVTFNVRNVRCGLLICHDFRYPELFREYKKQGVELMLVSFHNAGMPPERFEDYKVYVSATLQAAAASNYFSISATNGTRRHAWSSFVVDPEGIVISKARPHRPEVLINTIDTSAKHYDASIAWRDRAMSGIFHSGTLVRDPRSRDRRSI